MAPPLPERHIELTVEEWGRLPATDPAADEEPLPEAALAGLGVRPEPALAPSEVERVYLPLARLLKRRAAATRELATAEPGLPAPPSPFVIALTGSVAVGKSATARLLAVLLARGPGAPTVAVVGTDGFLLPTIDLERRGLLARKGFPESYDQRRLLGFLADVKGGAEVEAPVYSHQRYDVVPDSVQVVPPSDIVIIEGLHLLWRPPPGAAAVTDVLDFTLYLDAEEDDLEAWYIERYLDVRIAAAPAPGARSTGAGLVEAVAQARGTWHSVNAVNLRDNIVPTRERADLILEKGPGHRVRRIFLRPS